MKSLFFVLVLVLCPVTAWGQTCDEKLNTTLSMLDEYSATLKKTTAVFQFRVKQLEDENQELKKENTLLKAVIEDTLSKDCVKKCLGY